MHLAVVVQRVELHDKLDFARAICLANQVRAHTIADLLGVGERCIC